MDVPVGKAQEQPVRVLKAAPAPRAVATRRPAPAAAKAAAVQMIRMGVALGNNDGQVQQFMQQFRPILRSEYHIVRVVCRPTPEQRQQIARAGEQALRDAAMKYVDMMRRPMTAAQRAALDPRKQIREGLARAVKADALRRAGRPPTRRRSPGATPAASSSPSATSSPGSTTTSSSAPTSATRSPNRCRPTGTTPGASRSRCSCTTTSSAADPRPVRRPLPERLAEEDLAEHPEGPDVLGRLRHDGRRHGRRPARGRRAARGAAGSGQERAQPGPQPAGVMMKGAVIRCRPLPVVTPPRGSRAEGHPQEGGLRRRPSRQKAQAKAATKAMTKTTTEATKK